MSHRCFPCSQPTYDNQAIQLVKLSGFSPIITTSSLKHENYLKTLGATHVVDRNLPPPLEVKKIANQSIPFVFDAIGDRSTQQAGLDILAPGGTLVTVLVEKVKAHDKTMLHVVALLTAPPHLKLLETLYGKKLSGWLAEGVIKVRESRDVWEAIRLMTFCDSPTELSLFPVVLRQYLQV